MSLDAGAKWSAVKCRTKKSQQRRSEVGLGTGAKWRGEA
jgi:hypothetical protein